MTCRALGFLARTILAVVLLVGSAAPLSSQTVSAPAPKAEAPRSRETVYSLILKGGYRMIPIVICSLVVLTVWIERSISLRKSRIGSPDLLDKIFAAVPSRADDLPDGMSRAAQLCEGSRTIEGRLIAAGMTRLHRDEARFKTHLEELLEKQLHVLKRSLRPLSTSAAVAPLLGLLGTVFGMITCFESATAVDAVSRSETLTKGIYEALVTTAASLCVAVPALVIFHYFQGRVDRIADRLEESASLLVDHYYGDATGRSSASMTQPEPLLEPPPDTDLGVSASTNEPDAPLHRVRTRRPQ